MARIKIADLPVLQDLTEEQLKELFGAGAKNYKPTFEALEDRRLMSGFTSVIADANAPAFNAAIYQISAPVASSPIQSIQQGPDFQQTTGLASQLLASLDQPIDPTIDYSGGIDDGVGELPGLPILNSNPGAKTTLYLNFTGERGDFSIAGVTVFDPGTNLKGSIGFDLDGDPTSFNASEQAMITQVWKYVASDYATFDVNVTTFSGLRTFGSSDHTLEVAIGGQTPPSASYDKNTLGFTHQTGAFFHGDHTVHVWSDSIRALAAERGESAYLAERVAGAAAHEAGHAFGLEHQSDANPQSSDLNHGTADWGPIMGYNTTKRVTWWSGPAHDLGGKNQDDIVVLGKGLGYRKDDVIGWQAMFESKEQPGEFYSQGFIGAPDGDGNADWDSYRFESKGGPVSVQLNASGPNSSLRAELQLWRSDGTFMGHSARDEWTNSLTYAWLPAGTYFVGVGSTGGYGNLGTYWLHVSAPNPGQSHANLSPIGNLAGLASTTGLSAQATVLNPLDAAFIQAEFAAPGLFDAQSQMADFTSINQDMSVVPYSPQSGSDAADVFAQGLNQGVTGSYQTRMAIAPDQLQARLVELDQAIAQTQQDLQGALAAQAQFTAEGEQIQADIQAAMELSPDGTAPNLADLQASQAQNTTALDQNQQQINQLQTQLDLFTTEQSLIGSTLAEADATRANPMDDFTGVTFSLNSLDTGEAHQLQIQDQSDYLPAVDAVRQQYPAGVVGAVRQEVPGETQPTITFNALWDGSQVSGTLSQDESGNVLVRFNSGSLEAGTLHTFMGTITGEAGAYHIEATDTLRRSGPTDNLTGDQTVVGDQSVGQTSQVADFTNATFALSEENGTAHQFQITDQATQPDGSATFNGVWDGQSVTGTLAYDDAGNLHITFILSDGSSVDGALSGQPGAYHFEGMMTPADGSSLTTVVGDQEATPAALVTDFTNVTFALTDEGGTAHQLQITDQTAQLDGTATFNGVWDGQNVAGTLANDDAGNVHVTFILSDGSSVDGTLSGQPGAYHFEGMMTPADGSSLTTVVGDQDATRATPVTDFTNVTFALTDEGGTAHQLQITDQTAQLDGTATFNGAWDGQSVTGTLAYDDAGNIHILFSGDSGTCDGAISGNFGAFQIDGNLTVGDALVPVAGNQIA